jgi:uncharacterized RDD family membrane protein YckC
MPTDLATPSFSRTLAALFYELLLTAAVLLALATLLTPLKALLGSSFAAEQLFRLLLAALLFAYFGWCWVKGGQTLAMKTWRLKLVRADGRALDWPTALRRYLIALALFVGVPALAYAGWSRSLGEAGPLWLALIWLPLPFIARGIDPEQRSLHDRLAGTRVVWLGKK